MLAVVKWVLAFGFLLVISIPIGGLMISASWNWFVVPVTGAQEMSVAQGVGLSFFLSAAGRVATAHTSAFGEVNEERLGKLATVIFWKAFDVAVIGPLSLLAGAWLWHTFFVS